MPVSLRNPLVFFDLETTGTSIVHDRIIEMAFIKMHPNGEREERQLRVNPGIPIPEESSRIHGISDEDIADSPPFKSVAKELAQWLKGADLAGFSIIKFDVPMLTEEFLRADVPFDVSKRKIVDSQKIFHLMEKRNLTSAYKFYCDKDLVDAHSAQADTEAALDILNAQVERYSNQEVQDNLGNSLGTIANDVETLHAITNQQLVDLAGRMIRKDDGIYINFGKHRGKKVVDVLAEEPAYYDWVMNGEFSLDTKRRLTEIKLSMK